MRALYVSGGLLPPPLAAHLRGAALLAKPFGLQELDREIQAVADGAPPGKHRASRV